ncbi:MaoC/PaaZ C-terminal domain-containing protein [Candidatus Frankia alpina]|uniref:MaoC/PaaZ C-terminal domain-containing protein n=1 Tax=Candidatus Frankia alpina TaxID=2699483 RepID=UPI003AF46A59
MAVSGSAPAAAQQLPLDGDLPERWFGPLTMTDIVRYQGASGDLNPMHHDDELARGAGYPQAFGVGMLGAGYLATWLSGPPTSSAPTPCAASAPASRN